MRRSRRAFAFLSLAAFLSPFAAAAATMAHVAASTEPHQGHAGHAQHDRHDADQHDDGVGHVAKNDDDGHDHAADLQQIWHGHKHDKTTPEHGHPSVFAIAPAALGPAAPRLIPNHGSHSIEYAGVAFKSKAGVRIVPGLLDAGPSPPVEPPTILRV